jgi:hypothetical protein
MRGCPRITFTRLRSSTGQTPQIYFGGLPRFAKSNPCASATHRSKLANLSASLRSGPGGIRRASSRASTARVPQSYLPAERRVSLLIAPRVPASSLLIAPRAPACQLVSFRIIDSRDSGLSDVYSRSAVRHAVLLSTQSQTIKATLVVSVDAICWSGWIIAVPAPRTGDRHLLCPRLASAHRRLTVA